VGGDVVHIREMMNTYIISIRKSQGRRPLRILRFIYDDNITRDLKVRVCGCKLD
jgi:hypothetical protein